jgi:hypothetical protein
MAFNDAVSITDVIYSVQGKREFKMAVTISIMLREGFWRNWRWPFSYPISALTLGNCGEQEQISVRIADNKTEVLTEYLQNERLYTWQSSGYKL